MFKQGLSGAKLIDLTHFIAGLTLRKDCHYIKLYDMSARWYDLGWFLSTDSIVPDSPFSRVDVYCPLRANALDEEPKFLHRLEL